MNVIKTEIPGVVIIEPQVFDDRRGYFFESWNQERFNTAVQPVTFVQDNESSSRLGVVRGLHFQRPPYAQAKLVRCVMGRVLDVAVDIRRGSPTYGKYVAVELNESNHRQLFLPRGMAHGFAVLSPKALFLYKCDNYYNHEAEGGICLFDPQLNIDWPVSFDMAILSDKDRLYPTLDAFDSPFTYTEE